MDDYSDETVDPRIQDQLECLNTCTDEINHLELQLDEANSTFRNTLSDYSQRLKQLMKKLGKCVHVARPYYDAETTAKLAKIECEKAAVQYQRACCIHREAREAIALAEQRFLNRQNVWEFDAAWQEMLNHETMKLMKAEALKLESEKDHEHCTHMFAAAEENVKSLEKQLKKDILKSRCYFEQKNVFQRTLEDLKGRVESLQKAVTDAKMSYANSLHNLEKISEEIHHRRRLLQPREPGVGAELQTSPSTIDICKLSLSDIESLTDSDSLRGEDHVAREADSGPVLSLPLLEVPVVKTPAASDLPSKSLQKDSGIWIDDDVNSCPKTADFQGCSSSCDVKDPKSSENIKKEKLFPNDSKHKFDNLEDIDLS